MTSATDAIIHVTWSQKDWMKCSNLDALTSRISILTPSERVTHYCVVGDLNRFMTSLFMLYADERSSRNSQSHASEFLECYWKHVSSLVTVGSWSTYN